jgi:glutamate formiminotransferase / 5-formyltetrahydrofolate cyclo-ligase
MLLAVPNVSEGRDRDTIDAVARAFRAGGAARLLDVHADGDHHRSVFTLAGEQGRLASALVGGAREALQRIDLDSNDGVHPHVGVIDVVPLVYLDAAWRGAACAEALVTADELARQLELPVLLYGALGGGRTRAQLRRGGLAELDRRMRAGEIAADFGASRLDPRAGAVLVTARPPLVAFNLELAAPATLDDARAIAAEVREGGAHGLSGVRALGVALSNRGELSQVTLNIEDPLNMPLARVVEAVRAAASRAGVSVAAAELVGLAPRAAFDGFPGDLPIPGFDPGRHLIENALAASGTI